MQPIPEEMTVGSFSLPLVPSDLLSYARTPTGRKTVRFAMVSVVAIALSQGTNFLGYGLFKLTARNTQLLSFVVSTVPSYYLNRAWVWQKNGRSSVRKEVVPFWAISIIQLIISLAYVAWAQELIENATTSHPLRTLGFLFNTLFIYGVMWIGKFFFFNRVLFVHKPHPEA
jgi:putative flippase GtrA